MSVQPVNPAKKATRKQVNRQIGAYSLAAAAAGVSVLALAAPATGEVIVTKKTIPIPVAFFGDGVEISLTNNGVNNFRLSLLYDFSSISTNIDGRILILNNLTGHEAAVGSNQNIHPYASALTRGAKIGPPANFVSSRVGDPYGVNLEESATVTYLHRGSKHLNGKWGAMPTIAISASVS